MDVAVEEAKVKKVVAAPDSENVVHEAREAGAMGKAPSGLRFSPGAQVVGEIVGLLIQSPAHKHLFLADLEWLIGPPLALRQFRIFHDDKKPAAVALWASVSDEVEKELGAGRTRMRPNEWKSGKNLWLVELIAPSLTGNAEVIEGLLAELSEKAFAGGTFKMRTQDATGKGKVVVAQRKSVREYGSMR